MNAVAGRRPLSLPAKDGLLGVALIAPTVLIFSAVIAYQLLSAIYLSLFSIYTPTLQGDWVGLANYGSLLAEAAFWRSLSVTLVWTIGTLSLQLVAGVLIALLLHQNILFRSLARSLILFPYFVSTVVAVLVWRWLFNDLYGILNHLLVASGLVDMPVDWLGQMPNAMISVILVGTWKYFPFVVIAVLARLQSIPEHLYEAATIDGANAWARFWDVTLPELRAVLLVVLLLRTIWDFKEFDLIYLLTGGGPLTSIKPQTELFRIPPSILPQSVTFEHYRQLLEETPFLKYFGNSVLLACSTTVLVVAVGTLGAFSLVRFRYPGRDRMALLVLATYLLPSVVLIIPLYLLMVWIGVANSLFSLVIAYTTFSLPYALWLLRSFMAGIPADLESAALVDGASRLGAFVDVILPQALPGIISTTLFTFILAWNEYLYALVLVNTDEARPLTTGVMNMLVTSFNIEWSLLMAAAVLMSLPLIVIFAFLQSYLTRGFGAGGVKG